MNPIKLAATIVLSLLLVLLLFDGGDPSIEGEAFATDRESPDGSVVEAPLIEPDLEEEERETVLLPNSEVDSAEASSAEPMKVISGRVLPPSGGAGRLMDVLVVGTTTRNVYTAEWPMIAKGEVPDGIFVARCDSEGRFEFPPGPEEFTLVAGGGGLATRPTVREEPLVARAG